MRKVMALLICVLGCLAGRAQGVQDFASRLMERCADDTAIYCITISPKMMEQLAMKQADDRKEEMMARAIQKLKSARIITASTKADHYYGIAEELLERNKQRFHHGDDYRKATAYGSFYTRNGKGGTTVELILLHADQKKDNMVVVNLTGDLDEEFVETLRENFSGNRKVREGDHDGGQK